MIETHIAEPSGSRRFDPVVARLLIASMMLIASLLPVNQQRSGPPSAPTIALKGRKITPISQIAELGCLNPETWRTDDVLAVPGIRRSVAERLVALCKINDCVTIEDFAEARGVSVRLARRLGAMCCAIPTHSTVSESE